jgi:hypothetical protein
MTATPPSTQKPADPSPYSSLRPTVAADQPEVQRASNATPSALPSAFSAELAKLQEFRDALWDAFKAGPDAGLPTILIELTNCYTNTLRFQMNMKSLNSRKQQPTPQPSTQPSTVAKKSA